MYFYLKLYSSWFFFSFSNIYFILSHFLRFIIWAMINQHEHIGIFSFFFLFVCLGIVIICGCVFFWYNTHQFVFGNMVTSLRIVRELFKFYFLYINSIYQTAQSMQNIFMYVYISRTMCLIKFIQLIKYIQLHVYMNFHSIQKFVCLINAEAEKLFLIIHIQFEVCIIKKKNTNKVVILHYLSTFFPTLLAFFFFFFLEKFHSYCFFISLFIYFVNSR